MASGTVLILVSISTLLQVCRGQEVSRESVLSWFRGRFLDGLGLDQPPQNTVRLEAGSLHRRGQRARRWTGTGPQPRSNQDSSQIIVFPNSDSSCDGSDGFSYRFHPSASVRDAVVTSARFWFYSGPGTNVSASLSVVTETRPAQVVDAPSDSAPDGWSTFHLDGGQLGHAPFLIRVVCPSCRCHDDQDKTPFLHLEVLHRGSARFPRSASVPWSPSAVSLLQRPSPENPACRRFQVELSFRELGWDSWVVQPAALAFHYCHGNCSAPPPLDGATRCCAPDPGTMRSLKVTTTSDGGLTFRDETLPNILPEDCACF